MISSIIIFSLYVTAFIIILLPIILIITFKIKTKSSLIPVLAGLLTFLIFAQGLESIPHFFCITQKNPVSELITNSTFLYVLYGISMAGIFEEVGRFVVFNFFLKKHKSYLTPISFGLGHGGIENIIVPGVMMFQFVLIAKKINDGTTDELFENIKDQEYAIEIMKGYIETVKNMDLWYCVLIIIERIVATIVHVDLSIIVYKGIIENKKWQYLILAILFHAFFDIFPALYQRKVINLFTTEALIIVIMFLISYYAKNVLNTIKILIEDNEKEIEKKEMEFNEEVLN